MIVGGYKLYKTIKNFLLRKNAKVVLSDKIILLDSPNFHY